jgi:omega-amidase
MLSVSIIQSNLFWENADLNLKQFETKINLISEETDVIVLPEMFTTGFTMNPTVFSETHKGKGFCWMQKMAASKKCAIVGSISVNENGLYYNRLYWVFPDGSFQFYNKRHLFSMGKENEYYSSGKEKIIIEYKGWKICPLVCYDLRFPVYSRNTKNNTYDVLLYVANWPSIRVFPWMQLLIARAIENQCYVVGVNRVGEDGNKVLHSGNSLVVNYRGEIINNLKPNEEKTEIVILNKNILVEFRGAFPVLNDGDDFTIN